MKHMFPAAYRCWVLRLSQFIFVIANNNADESHHGALDVVQKKVGFLPFNACCAFLGLLQVVSED